MGKRAAIRVFIGICLLLAVLLLLGTITPVVGTLAFAVSLVTIGTASKGIRI